MSISEKYAPGGVERVFDEDEGCTYQWARFCMSPDGVFLDEWTDAAGLNDAAWSLARLWNGMGVIREESGEAVAHYELSCVPRTRQVGYNEVWAAHEIGGYVHRSGSRVPYRVKRIDDLTRFLDECSSEESVKSNIHMNLQQSRQGKY